MSMRESDIAQDRLYNVRIFCVEPKRLLGVEPLVLQDLSSSCQRLDRKSTTADTAYT